MNKRDLSWMKWMCDPLRAGKAKLGIRRDDDSFQIMAKPWTIPAASGQNSVWSVATNGGGMVAVRGFGGFAEASDSIRLKLSPHLRREARGGKFDFLSFKHWCGTVWKRSLPCPDCDGVWAETCPICFGQGCRSSKCPDCGHEHECLCPSCGSGKGVVYCDSCVGDGLLRVDHCVIGGVVFDRALIAQHVAEVGADQVRISVGDKNGGKGLHIDEEHGTWSILVMPLTGEPDVSYPRWSLSGL